MKKFVIKVTLTAYEAGEVETATVEREVYDLSGAFETASDVAYCLSLHNDLAEEDEDTKN